jgi:hypothetical protein
VTVKFVTDAPDLILNMNRHATAAALTEEVSSSVAHAACGHVLLVMAWCLALTVATI